MKKLMLVIVPILAGASSHALARDDDMRARGDRACNGDARRLCSPYLGKGDDAVLHCFQSNRKRLGAKCFRFLREAGQL